MTDVKESLDVSPAPVGGRSTRTLVAGALSLVALVVTAVVVLGGVVAVTLSGATLIRDGVDAPILEWVPPLSVWQWLIAGVIECVMIAFAAFAAWGAWSLWRGGAVRAQKVAALRFALGAAIGMIAATVLALVTHIHNWNEWHSVIAQHPEWHESAQNWQIPAGAIMAVLIAAAVVAGFGYLRRWLLSR